MAFVRHSNEHINQLAAQNRVCTICNESISEEQFSATPCRHTFHRECITTWLDTNDTCPLCRGICDTQSLKSFDEYGQRPSLDDLRGQGAIPRHAEGPITRQRAANLNNSQPIINSARRRGRGGNNNNYRSPRPNPPDFQINQNQFEAMIENSLRVHQERTSREIHDVVRQVVNSSLASHLQNLNLNNNPNIERVSRSNELPVLPQNLQPNEARSSIGSRHSEHQDRPLLDLPDNIYPNVVQNDGSAQARAASNSLSAGAVSKIITNWKLTFDGSSESISVDEFIYRVNALTVSTLRGNFNSLCQSAHILFAGRAKSWFWRYHHSANALDWFDICDDLRRNFKDFKTDLDIKESIRNRKQRRDENFETFFDGIMTLADGLRTPLLEEEMVQLTVRNLSPEIRLEILHLDLRTMSDLRKACRRRENLFAEVHNKYNFNKPFFQQQQQQQRRNVSEIEAEQSVDDEDISAITKTSISKPVGERKCWNCEETGHNYKNCLKPRRVFCYGCGLAAYFLPNCPQCNFSENRRRDAYDNNKHPKNSNNSSISLASIMVSTTLTTIAAGQLTSSSNHNQSSATLASSTANNSNYQRSSQHQQQQLQHHLSSSTTIGAATAPIPASHTSAATRNSYYYDITSDTLNGGVGNNSNNDTKTLNNASKATTLATFSEPVEITNHKHNPNTHHYKRPNSLFNGKGTGVQLNEYGSSSNSNSTTSHVVNHHSVAGETTKPDLLTSNTKSPQNDAINATATPTVNLTKSLLSASPPLTDQISLLFPKCRPKQPQQQQSAASSNSIQSSNLSNGSNANDVADVECNSVAFNGINNSPAGGIVESPATKTESEHSEKLTRSHSSGSYYKTVNIITQSPPPPSTSSVSSESLSSVTPRISTNPFLCPTLLTTSSINTDVPPHAAAARHHKLNEEGELQRDHEDDNVDEIDEELPVPAYRTFYYHTSSSHYNGNDRQSEQLPDIEGRRLNSYDMPRKARSTFSSYQQQQQHQHQQAVATQRQHFTQVSQSAMAQQQPTSSSSAAAAYNIGNHHQHQLHNGTGSGAAMQQQQQQQHQHHKVSNQSQNPFIKSNYWETRQSVTTAAANAVLNSPEYGGNEIELPPAAAAASAPPLASSRRAYHQQSYNSQTHYMSRQQQQQPQHHIRVGRSPVNHNEQKQQQKQQQQQPQLQQQLETSKRIGDHHQLNKPQPHQQQQHNADINHYPAPPPPPPPTYGNTNNSKTSIEQHVTLMDREQYERREREGRERDREQREHRISVVAAVVERDRERDNERERIREMAGICDVGPPQQQQQSSSSNKQQQQTYKQHQPHQKSISINNEGRLSVIADGEVVVFDDIAESWQNLRVTMDPNAIALPSLSPTTSPTQKTMAISPSQQQTALALCGQKDEILEMYQCENEPTSYREHKRYLDGNNYAITVETRHGIIEYEGSPRRIGKCSGTNNTPEDENAQVVAGGQQASMPSYNVAASSIASNSPQQYPARPGFPQRIISPPRESTPPMLLYNNQHNNFKQQQQQLQQQQQQSLQYPSPTDNNAEDTSNDVSEIGTLSDMTTPEVTSTTTAPPPPAVVAVTAADSISSANVVVATTALPTAASTAAATTTTTTAYTVNAIGNSSAVGLSLPAKSSTFDYLYEFSETRKVLEEFFKCPSSDEKPIENSSDVDSIDIQYEFQSNLDRDDDDEDEEPEEDDDDEEQLQQQLQQQQQQLQQQKLIQQQQQQQQQQFQQTQNNYNVHNQRRHFTSSPLMRDFDFFLDSASRSSGEQIDQQDGVNHNQLDARNNYRYSPETTDYDSNCGDLDSLSGELNGISTSCSNYAKYYASSMPVLEDGLSSGHTSDTENNNHNNINNNLQQQLSTVHQTPIGGGISMLMDMKRISTNNSINSMNNTTIAIPTDTNSIDKCNSSSISPNVLHDSYMRKNESPLNGLLVESGCDSVHSKQRELLGQSPSNNSNSKVFKNIDPDLDSLYSISVFQRPDMTQMTPPPPAPAPHRKPNQTNQQPQQQLVNSELEILQPIPYKDLRSSNTNTTSSTTTATSSVASAISSTLNRTKPTQNNTATTTPLQVLPTTAVARTNPHQPQPPPIPERAATNPQTTSPIMKSPVWVPRHLDTSASKALLESSTEHQAKNMSADEDDVDTDLETDRLLGHQRLDDQGYYDENKSWDRKPRSLLSKISPKQQHTSTKTRNGYNALLSSTPEIPPPVPPKNLNKKLLNIGNSSLSSPEHSDKSPEKSLDVQECVVAMGSPGGSIGSGCESHKKDHANNSNVITSSNNNNSSGGGGVNAQNNSANGGTNSNSAGSNSTTGEKKVKKSKNKEGGAVLIEGVLFRARYLGSTQLVCEGQPTKSTRMMQAEEAVSRIKAPDGDVQPSTEVDLFISTEKIMVLNTDLKEIMMDHALRTISYIADIGDLVVLMARRRFVPQDIDDAPKPNRTPKMICHVFESDEAQFIAQSIGQAFQVAYMEFLKANGIEDHSFVKEMDYQEVLNSQEIFGDELEIFAKKELQKEVVVPKAKGEILGVVIVESGWGSMLPTVVIANLMSTGAAARCGQLNIGDQLIAINGLSLVGLPLSTCQTYIKNSKNQTVVKFTVVPCAPVVEVKIKRPNTKYQLGFSVQNGVICSLLRGGIAERGGVRVGHRIIEINNQSVVAVPHEKIVNLLATSVGEILMKTMPTSMFRLLTGQENPIYI